MSDRMADLVQRVDPIAPRCVEAKRMRNSPTPSGVMAMEGGTDCAAGSVLGDSCYFHQYGEMR